MNLTDKNGKPLHGAAKQAVLNKHLGWQNDEIGVTLLSNCDRITRLERQTKYLPLTRPSSAISRLRCGEIHQARFGSACREV